MPIQTLIKQVQTHLPTAERYVLGFSGGADSHVLLDVLMRLKAANALRAEVLVVHVNHGVQAEAMQWQAHTQAIAKAYGVPFITERIHHQATKGESLEAFLRTARYAILEKYMDEKTVLLTAHHQRDQAETVLLALLRGSGLAGLAAMPAVKAFATGQHARPLLTVDYETVLAYANAAALDFIVDPSNADLRFDRNYIRHAVLPVLQQRFGRVEQQIAKSAQWLAEAKDLLRAQLTVPDTLSITALKQMPNALQKQTLRAFVQQKTGYVLNQKTIDYVLRHHLSAAADKHPVATVLDVTIRRDGDNLLLTKTLPTLSDTPFAVRFAQRLSLPFGALAWQAGLGLSACADLSLRPLPAGLRFVGYPIQQTAAGYQLGSKQAIVLKKYYQQQAVKKWLRPYYLGLYQQDRLCAIPSVALLQAPEKANTAYLPFFSISACFVKI